MKSQYIKVWNGVKYVYINKDCIVRFFPKELNGYGRKIDGVTICLSDGNTIEVENNGTRIIEELLEEEE